MVVEHDVEVMRRADWLVDVGPGAGTLGGRVLHSGPVAGLADVEESATRPTCSAPPPVPARRAADAPPARSA